MICRAVLLVTLITLVIIPQMAWGQATIENVDIHLGNSKISASALDEFLRSMGASYNWPRPGSRIAFEVVVKGKDTHGFVGVTIRNGVGVDQDLDVGEFEVSHSFLGRPDIAVVTVDCVLSEDLGASDYGGGTRLYFSVSTWRRFVRADKCRNGRGGEPCEYCQRNHYHMEGRMDSRDWQMFALMPSW